MHPSIESLLSLPDRYYMVAVDATGGRLHCKGESEGFNTQKCGEKILTLIRLKIVSLITLHLLEDRHR
jgi:hypothetical protein